MIHSNSSESFHGQSPRLNKREILILSTITALGPITDRAVKEALGFPDMNDVRPRITNLVSIGRVAECGNIICPVTGKTVRKVAVRRQLTQAPLL